MSANAPAWLNVLVFVLAAAAIWWAGARLERHADVIAKQTGIGQAFTGVLLLAAVTSLPEVATTVTAVALLHNPTLAVHNLLGGVAFQTLVLAVADAAKERRGALTFFSPKFVLLIQGVGLVVLLQIVVAGAMADGMPAPFATSVWLWLLLPTYVALMYFTYRRRGQSRWTPSGLDDMPREVREQLSPAERDGRPSADRARAPLARAWLRFGAMGVVILVGGWLAAASADALATQTGLGSAFVGATLLAAATSLPELSTTITAARSDRYTAAISNVFGSNAFDVTLLLLAEMLSPGRTILEDVESSVVYVATIGTLMTCAYLWGLMEREDRTVFGVGWDSAAAIVIYVAAMGVLYVIV